MLADLAEYSTVDVVDIDHRQSGQTLPNITATMLSALASADNDSTVNFSDGVDTSWLFPTGIRLVNDQSAASAADLLTSTSASGSGAPSTPQVAFDSVRFILPLTLLVVFNLIVVVGNSMVVAAVFTHRKLRTVTNVFIVSLATSDLMLGLLVLPSSSAYELLGNRWPFGAVWCQAWLAIDVWLCTASILNLVAISLDRYLAISRPFRYPTLMSPARARVAVAVVWTLALAICLPPLLGWRDSSPSDASSSLSTSLPADFDVERNWNWSEKFNNVYNSSSLSRNLRSISSINDDVVENSLLHRLDRSYNLSTGNETADGDAIDDSHQFTMSYRQRSSTSVAELLHFPTLDDVTLPLSNDDVINDMTTAHSPPEFGAAHSIVRNSKSVFQLFQEKNRSQNQGDSLIHVNDALLDTTDFAFYDNLLTPSSTQMPPFVQSGSEIDENVVTTVETESEDDSQYTVCALTSEPGYIIYSACGSFWIPMFVMVFFYVKIYRTAVRATNALRRGVVRTKAAAGPGCGSGPSSTSSAAESSLVNLRVHRGGRNESTAHSSAWSTSARLSNGATNESFVGGNFSRNSSQTALIPDLRVRGSVVDADSYQRASRCNGSGNSGSGTDPHLNNRFSLVSGVDSSAGGVGLDSIRQNYDVISMAVVSPTNGCGATRLPEENTVKATTCSYGTETGSNSGARSKGRGIFSSSPRGSSDIISVHRYNRCRRPTATSGTAESEFTSGCDDRRRTARFRRSLAASDLDDEDDDGDLMTSAPVSRVGSSCDAVTGSTVGGVETLLRSALTPVYEHCATTESADTSGTPGASSAHSRRVLVNIRTQLRRLNREKKAAKTVGIIVGGFVFCWTPFFAVYVLGAFCADCTPAVAFTVFFWLGYCNSAINPFVYALCSRDFRDAFRRLLRCGRSGARRPAMTGVSGVLAFGSSTSFRGSRIGTSLDVDDSRVGAVGAAAAGLAMAVARGLGRRRSRRQCRPNSEDFTSSICRH